MIPKIMRKHLLDNLELKKTLIYYFLMLGSSLAFLILTKPRPTSNFLAYKATLVSNYFLVGYLWICGLPFLLYTIYLSAGCISKEVSKGTFLLVLSRPVKRSHIIIGKFLSIVLYGMIINFALLAALPAGLVLFLHLDTTIVVALYKASLALMLYTLIISSLITSLGMVFSSKFENVIVTTIILIVGVLLILFLPTIFRVIIRTSTIIGPDFFTCSTGVNLLHIFGEDLANDLKGQLFSLMCGLYPSTMWTQLYYPSWLISPPVLHSELFWLAPWLIVALIICLLFISYFIFKNKEIY